MRDRDSLPDTDLSRTHRQQAVIDYVIWQLKHENAFSDIGQLTALLSDANQYVLTNNGFNLLDFATNMSALTGKNLKFYTMPISGYSDIELNGSMQDVNDIDTSYIQKVVNAAFNPPAPVAKSGKAAAKKKAAVVPPASTVTVDVYNGGYTPGLASAVSQALVSRGYKQGAIGDVPAGQTVTSATQVFYGAGASANAAKIAAGIGTTASALASLRAGQVEVLLGTASTVVPPGLASSSSSGSGTSTSQPTAAADNGDAGGVVTRRRERQVRNPLRVLISRTRTDL